MAWYGTARHGVNRSLRFWSHTPAPCPLSGPLSAREQEEELMRLLEVRAHPVCYDGFEPSGRMHIAQGVMRVINVNKLTK